MTEATTSSPGTNATADGQILFPPAEVETLHSSDREAARNIVCLLGGLFIVGIVLYTFVCIWTR